MKAVKKLVQTLNVNPNLIAISLTFTCFSENLSWSKRFYAMLGIISID